MICCSANILNISLLYLSKRQVFIWCYLCLLSTIIVLLWNNACIKLSELNLQQQLTESPWTFRKIMLFKIRSPLPDNYDFFFYIYILRAISWFAVPTAHRPTTCMSMHVRIIINVATNASTHFRINRKKTSHFRR